MLFSEFDETESDGFDLDEEEEAYVSTHFVIVQIESSVHKVAENLEKSCVSLCVLFQEAYL